MDFYKNSSGKEYLVQTKYEYTENPSIQGAWHPFVNADPEIAVAKFPMVNMFTKYFAVHNYAILTFPAKFSTTWNPKVCIRILKRNLCQAKFRKKPCLLKTSNN